MRSVYSRSLALRAASRARRNRVITQHCAPFSSQKSEDKKEETKESEDSGIFSQFRRELEKNEDLKKSFQDVKKAMPMSAVKDATEKLSETTKGLNEKAQSAAGQFKESSAKVAGDYGDKTRETVGSFVSQVAGELRSNFNFGSAKAGDKEATDGENKGSTEKDNSHKASESGDGETSSAQSGVSDRFQKVAETIRDKTSGITSSLPESFGNDDKTWDDALRAVFGLKPKNRRKRGARPTETAASAEPETDETKPKEAKAEIKWYEAVDEETGNSYYYTKDGETLWEKPDELKTPEELAKEWAAKEAEPSFLEKQIQAKSKEIGALETDRDQAMADSDMAKYKELNGQIRTLRKEIEQLSAQANTTAVVHVEEKKGAWEQFNDTLRDTPLLKDLFGFGEKISESDAARKARHVAEDAREAWETSQNPWVYRAYNAWESVFAETEMGETIRELRKLDPEFTFESMLNEMEEEIVPIVLKAYLRGDVDTLEMWCSEAAAGAVKASIKQRQAAGRKMDDNILSIDHMQVAAAKVVDKMGPLVVIQFMVQQIDCMYDLKGKVVDGKDDKVAAVFYAFALGREYNEVENELEWKIKEFAIVGTQPWL